MRVLNLFIGLLLSGCAAMGNVESEKSCSTLSHNDCRVVNIKDLCRETLEAYPLYRDQLMYADYGALFTETAKFQIGDGAPVVGREQITAALLERGPKIRTRHLTQIAHMKILDTSNIETISYVNVYKIEDQQDSLAPWIIGEYHDRLTLKEGRCLIENRLVKVVSRVD